MTTLFVIITQLVLAFAILSIIYLFVSIYLRRNFNGNQLTTEVLKVPDFERHLAIIFKDKINEEQLLLQVQWLLKQDYKNFTAYFFCSDEIVEYNSFQNIKIFNLNVYSTNPKELARLVKNYAPNLPAKILCVKSKTKLPLDFLFKHNEELFRGNLNQSYLNIDHKIESTGNWKDIKNWLSNKIEMINSLIENSQKNLPISKTAKIESIYFVAGILFFCSFILSGINSFGELNRSIFDYISLIGIAAVTVILINVNISKKWKHLGRSKHYS